MLTETKDFAQMSQMNISGWKKDDRLQLVNNGKMSLIWEKALTEHIATATCKKGQSNIEVIAELKTQDSHTHMYLNFLFCLWGEKDYNVQSKYIQYF